MYVAPYKATQSLASYHESRTLLLPESTFLAHSHRSFPIGDMLAAGQRTMPQSTYVLPLHHIPTATDIAPHVQKAWLGFGMRAPGFFHGTQSKVGMCPLASDVSQPCS